MRLRDTIKRPEYLALPMQVSYLEVLNFFLFFIKDKIYLLNKTL